MENKKLDELKKLYINEAIPEELDFVVKKALKEGKSSLNRKKNYGKMRIAAASIAVGIVALTVVVNSNKVFAETLSKVPIINSIVKVLIFREYTLDNGNFKADIKVPAIQGLENKNLQNSLNEKYLNENKQLYEKFMADMKELKQKGDGHEGISTGYEVKTDNDLIFSVGRYVLTTAGSSNTVLKYDTIDKKKQILITLPSLFKDDRYIDAISSNIISQMKEQMKSPDGEIYWIEGNADQYVTPFTKIAKDQSFYINKDNKLVISFNKYEVAPGVMGTPEFVIPTEAISDILVGKEYIK